MTIKNPKVSVIIPAYNEERYLRRCLDTVVSQTLEEIEIIIVDDGSTDSTPQICDEYKIKFPQKVKVIHKNNEGQGLARNAGIEIASGEYIGFVDSDDWIEKEMFLKMYENAVKNDSDMVICDVKKLFVETNLEVIEKSLPKSINKINIGEYIKGGLNPAYAWNKLYKREIWSKFRFKKMVYEDLELILTIEGDCKSISYIQEAFYIYYKRPGSTTTSYNKIQLLDIMTAYKNAIYNVNPVYKNETVFCVAKRILKNLDTPGMNLFKAEFIELINELANYFIENDYIKNDEYVKKIYEYFNIITLPKNIFYPNFGMIGKHDEIYDNMINWEKYTRNISFIELNEQSCSIQDAPKIIQSEYVKENYDFVGDYFKLKFIYENGGIAIDKDIKFSSPLGKLRAEDNFFCFNIDKGISTEIFGAQKNNESIYDLIKSYEKNNCNNELISLAARIKKILVKNGLVNDCTEQRLKNKFTLTELKF